LIGEKFLAAPGMAAPVDVAAFAVQPIEFTKRITAAAKTVNVSFRMGSPIRVAITFRVNVRSISLSVLIFNRPSNRPDRNLVFHANFKNLRAPHFRDTLRPGRHVRSERGLYETA
jgi:hypothetical protein